MTRLHRFLLLAAMLAAAPAWAQDWGAVANISATMGVSANRLCYGEASRGDIGCPADAPTVSGSTIIGTFVGDGSGLTGVTAASADRIVSGTAKVIANGNSNSISITESGVTTGYYYNGIWVAGGVSTTGAGKFNNVSVTANADIGGIVGIGATAGISPGISLQIGSGLPTETASKTLRLSTRNGYYSDIYAQNNTSDSFGIMVNGVQVLRSTGAGLDKWVSGYTGLGIQRPGGSVPLTMFIDGTNGGAYVYAIGNTGTVTKTPSNSLQVNGAIQIAAETSATTNTCDSNRTGAIRYTGGNFQVCYGTGGWANLADASSTVATADRITSGTAQVIANGNSNSISITEAGVTTGYYYGGVWVAGGVSTTGKISATNLYVSNSIGIGTTNPSYSLHVLGDIASSNPANGRTIRLDSGNANLSYGGSGPFFINRFFANDILLGASGGRVGIATVTPTTALEVSGTVSATNFVGKFSGDGSGLTGISTVSDRLVSGTSTAILSPNGNLTVRGFLDIVTNSNVVAVGNAAALNNLSANVTAVGLGAAQNNSGTNVTSVGNWAGKQNTGSALTAVGYGAGWNNSGSTVTLLGGNTGFGNSGNYLTAVGTTAGYSNAGNYVTALGYAAGYSNTSDNLTVVGYAAGQSNSGTNVTSLGQQAGRYNTGTNVTSVGYAAAYSNGGDLLTAIGNGAGQTNTGGAVTAVGYTAAQSNTAAFVVAVGSYAGQFNTGNYLTALGYTAGRNNTGQNNTAVGYTALAANTSGINNTGLGTSAMVSNTTGSQNTALGEAALFSNATSSYNTAVGWQALYTNIGGASNSGFGASALLYNQNGSYNTAVGINAARGASAYDVTGTTALGYFAGSNLATNGNYNTLLGYSTGQTLTTGASNILIGASADAPAANSSFYLNIGNAISGTMVSNSSLAFIGGIKANGTVTATYFEGDGSRLSNLPSATSDRLISGTSTAILDPTGNLTMRGRLDIVTGTNIVAVGAGAAQTASSGTFVTAVGVSAARFNNTATYTTAMGYAAGYNNSGASSALYGANAGYQNIGTYLTAVGAGAGTSNTGNYVTALGAVAGYSNTADYLTAVGYYAGQNNSGYGVTALGYQAGRYNTGNNITALGQSAGSQNTGAYITAMGYSAAYQNSGTNVTALGYQAAQNNTKDLLTAVGHGAGQNNVGLETTLLGYTAGMNNSADYVTAMGLYAGRYNTGAALTAMGDSAATSNTGTAVTGIGYQAARFNSGNSSTMVGYQSGVNNSGAGVTALGYYAGVSNTFGNVTLLGNSVYTADKANQVVLGNSSVVEVSTAGIYAGKGVSATGIVTATAIYLADNPALTCGPATYGTTKFVNGRPYYCRP